VKRPPRTMMLIAAFRTVFFFVLLFHSKMCDFAGPVLHCFTLFSDAFFDAFQRKTKMCFHSAFSMREELHVLWYAHTRSSCVL
jgi:hypothetical protein